MAKRRHSQFRPCIDLHAGVVKQIVGGTLDLASASGAELKTNFVAEWVMCVVAVRAKNEASIIALCRAVP
jgi:phosphoribosylformimino-5-aminoimidazole carboxamide ribonucleotide (ProFAR) isomerase